MSNMISQKKKVDSATIISAVIVACVYIAVFIAEQMDFSTFSDAVTFVLLIVILVFKPTGLFGEKATDKV